MNRDSFLNSKMNQESTIRENSRIVPTLRLSERRSINQTILPDILFISPEYI